MLINIPNSVAFIIDTLNNSGYEAYIVGGCVRDSLLGIVPKDYDVCTSAKPETVVSLFEKTAATGIEHGTVTVISQGVPVEVTTFRLDGGYKDFRHPEKVSFTGSLKEDLSRRDFTVNAMCYSEKTGLIDYFGGVNDLKNKTVRAVGEANLRFNEDALRILRLFRFCSALDFAAEEATFCAAIKGAHLLKNISAERIEKELRLTAAGKNPAAVLPLIKTGAIPVLRPDSRIERIPLLPQNEKLTFFAFLKILSEDSKKTLAFLKCSNSFKEYCHKMGIALKQKSDTRADIKRLLRFLEEDIFDLFQYKSAILCEDTEREKTAAEDILNNHEPYRISQLAISGEDIKNKGYSGKQIGDILEKLLDAVTENPDINTKEKLNTLF